MKVGIDYQHFMYNMIHILLNIHIFSEGIFGHYGYQGAMLLLSAISLETFVCAALFRPLDLHKKISKTQGINK